MHERPHHKLIAWKEAYSLCLGMYVVTKSLPTEERFALGDQIRRSATSVPLNIAEGNAKRTPKEKRRYFEIALASLEELHCQISIARDLQYLSKDTFTKIDDHMNRVSYLLTRLRGSFA